MLSIAGNMSFLSCIKGGGECVSDTSMQRDAQIKYYKNIVDFTGALCGCGKWSFVLKEKHRLRALNNNVLKGMF
jgi:hypothetical protein